MHLFLVRHGECLAQTDPALGNHPDTPLSPRGEKQALVTAARLQDQSLSHIVSSPLLRALDTASRLAETAGYAIDVWPELCEGWLGRYRSFPRRELAAQFPRAVLPASITEEGWTHPGDDTYAAFYARAEAVVQRLKATFAPDDRVAIITHGGLGSNLLHALLQIPPATPQWFELANGSISRMRLVPDPEKERPNWPLYPPVPVEVLSINETSHLVGT